jgi:hypothetical protein
MFGKLFDEARVDLADTALNKEMRRIRASWARLAAVVNDPQAPHEQLSSLALPATMARRFVDDTEWPSKAPAFEFADLVGSEAPELVAIAVPGIVMAYRTGRDQLQELTSLETETFEARFADVISLFRETAAQLSRSVQRLPPWASVMLACAALGLVRRLAEFGQISAVTPVWAVPAGERRRSLGLAASSRSR